MRLITCHSAGFSCVLRSMRHFCQNLAVLTIIDRLAVLTVIDRLAVLAVIDRRGAVSNITVSYPTDLRYILSVILAQAFADELTSSAMC